MPLFDVTCEHPDGRRYAVRIESGSAPEAVQTAGVCHRAVEAVPVSNTPPVVLAADVSIPAGTVPASGLPANGLPAGGFPMMDPAVVMVQEIRQLRMEQELRHRQRGFNFVRAMLIASIVSIGLLLLYVAVIVF